MATFNIPTLKPVAAEKESAKGHTYIHFGGDMKRRFKVLAEEMGYTRKMNDLGVAIFKVALDLVEKEHAANVEAAKKQAK